MKALFVFCCVLLLHGTSALAQGSAIRLIIFDYEKILDSEYDVGIQGAVGFGFDHDVTDRSSIGLECAFMAGYDLEATTIKLRSAYHFSTVDYGSFYVATTVGYRAMKVRSSSFTDVPIGMRFGYRGTLPQWSADFFGGIQVHPGARNRTILVDNTVLDAGFSTVTYNFGMHVSIGWEH